MSPKYSPVQPEEEAPLCSDQGETGEAHGRSSTSGSSTDFERDPEFAPFVPHGKSDHSGGRRRRPRAAALAGLLSFPAWKFVVVFLSAWGLVDVARRSAHALQGRPPAPPEGPAAPGGDLSFYCRRNCGKSMAEAEAKGCVWDELEFRFTRPECINQETQDDFRKAGPGRDGMWEYAVDVDWQHADSSHGNINDGNMTIINSEELIPLVQPGKSVWHSNLWHISHCLWYWRKAALARFDGTLLPMGREEEAEHGYHCTRMVINYLRKEHLTDQFKTSFTF